MEIKGRIVAKTANNKAVLVGDKWFNMSAQAIPYLTKLEKGDEVTIVYEKSGKWNNASKIIKVIEEAEPEIEKTTEEKPKAIAGGDKGWNNPERTRDIKRGNALNAASGLLAGRPEDPETLAEIALVVAQKFYDWLSLE